MNISKHITMLEIGGGGSCFASLLHDGDELILVDTGYPKETQAVINAIEKAGFRAQNLTCIIITHQDIDHIGGINELKKLAPHAVVMAHSVEAPYISGVCVPTKVETYFEAYDTFDDDKKRWYDGFKAGYAKCKAPVDKLLEQGDTINIAGGVQVIFTPGHTPGHICLYCAEAQLLICGDAVNIAGGVLTGPNPFYTKHMDEAHESLKKLLPFNAKRVICYHGGLFEGDVNAGLQNVINDFLQAK